MGQFEEGLRIAELMSQRDMAGQLGEIKEESPVELTRSSSTTSQASFGWCETTDHKILSLLLQVSLPDQDVQ